MGLALNYPDAHIAPYKGVTVGGDVTKILRDTYPGNIDPEADLVIRWGQNTDIPRDKDIVIFDCGYFHRENSDRLNRHFRFSINEYHPKNLPEAPPDRWLKLGIELENLYNPEGHIILVGRGRKTRIQQGSSRPVWEQQAYEKIRSVFPKRKIIYRPKKMPHERIRGTKTDCDKSIRDLCKGASLIYTQRSNIGNEGILYGIPVISEDGPATDVCWRKIDDPLLPLPMDLSLRFLEKLAYWQWSLNEMMAGEIWPWLLSQVQQRSKIGRTACS